MDQIKVSVLLTLPSLHNDLFQLTGELLSANGSVMARAMRTHTPLVQPSMLRLIRQVVLVPCYALGLCAETSTVSWVP